MALVETRVDGCILVLTLNRPEALNAFTIALHEQFAAAISRAQATDIRAVVLTGAGRGFCAGQDLDELTGGELTPAECLERYYNPNIASLRELSQPVVAAVNGPAAGAGLGLALVCDIRIASASASFVPGFVGIGLVPDSGASWTTVRLLGYARAFEWMTSNRKLTAEQALELGLVHEVAEPDALLDRAIAQARTLADMPGDAVVLTKQLMRRAEFASLPQQLELERQLQDAASQHRDHAAEVAKFIARSSSRAARVEAT
jgi:2-(1,2-epoxy-1,2-dihydrophenyl)acetyl-CoA isomerase